jgi:multidrug efflux pump subunit AcrA (membrane-fusion protein)
MRFQGTIELGRIRNAVLIPREAVFVSSDGPFVYRRGAVNVDVVPVQLGKQNDKSVQVLQGLSSGERILVPKEKDEEEKAS